MTTNDAILPGISVVVPAHNEEANIEELYGRLSSTLEKEDVPFEIIFVDDGSTDRTLELVRALSARDPRVRYASFSRNFGHEAASTCGMNMVRNQAAVLMDADLQDPPELIPRMIEAWKGGAEIVYARRESRRGEGVLKRATSFLFYRVMNWMSDIRIPVDVGDFRFVDRRVVDAFNRLPERNRFVRGLFFWVGFRHAVVGYDRPPRRGGATKYNWLRLLFLSMDAFFGFSLVPLRLCISLGILVVAFSSLMSIVIVAQRLFFGLAIPGYALIATAIFFFGGVQLTFLGVIGEYVGKIYTEVQQRPLYIVKESTDG